MLLIEGGEKETGQRDLGGTDYVAAYFKTDPITGMFFILFTRIILIPKILRLIVI